MEYAVILQDTCLNSFYIRNEGNTAKYETLRRGIVIDRERGKEGGRQKDRLTHQQVFLPFWNSVHFDYFSVPPAFHPVSPL